MIRPPANFRLHAPMTVQSNADGDRFESAERGAEGSAPATASRMALPWFIVPYVVALIVLFLFFLGLAAFLAGAWG